MLIKTRKYSGYTSILLKEVSLEAFREASIFYDSLEGEKVVRLTKEALQSFIKLHSLTLDKVEEGEDYKCLGTTFHVIRKRDLSRGGDEWFPIVTYYDRAREVYQDVGIISTELFALGVHEICFRNYTGKSLY